MVVINALKRGWDPMWAHIQSKYFICSVASLIAVFVAMMIARVDLQWFWMLLFALVTVPFAPWAADPVKYFRGGLVSDHKQSAVDGSNWTLLAASCFVSWIFAKGILNTSTLGASFGVVGGLAYSAWFVAFFSVALVTYLMRTRFGYRSLPEAIHARYGGMAALAFGLAVAYRLEQEVWSNSLVVASFYGPVHSPAWWAAAIVSTAIPAFYCFTGGMRASLFTDVFQAVVKVVFLVAVVAVVGVNAPAAFHSFTKAGSCSLPADLPANSSKDACTALNMPLLLNETGGLACPEKSATTFTAASCNYTAINSSNMCAAAAGTWQPPACAVSQAPTCAAAGTWIPRPMWSLQGGLDMLIVGLLQGFFSYPFFDPVLTDRAFLGQPGTMVKAFVSGGIMAILFIFLFSFVGIFGAMIAILKPETVPCDIYTGMLSGQPSAIARYFGTAVFSLVNLIFLVSSCTVLDSTFASTSKLFGPELLGAILRGRPLPPQMATRRHAWAGRVAIVLMAVVGTLPLLAGPSALDATTISGTMVVGLGPPVFFLTFIRGYRPLTFHLPFWCGVSFGVVMQLVTTYKDSINASGLKMGTGHYSLLLGVNVISAICCWGLGALSLLDNRQGRDLAGRDLPCDACTVDAGDAMLTKALPRVAGELAGKDAAAGDADGTARADTAYRPGGGSAV